MALYSVVAPDSGIRDKVHFQINSNRFSDRLGIVCLSVSIVKFI